MKELDFDRDIVPLRDRMFRYAQSLLLCAAEAEDVVHDLLERFWRERERLCVRSDVGSFVMTAVRNRCYDSLRRREADRRRGEAAACRTDSFAAEDAERGGGPERGGGAGPRNSAPPAPQSVFVVRSSSIHFFNASRSP